MAPTDGRVAEPEWWWGHRGTPHDDREITMINIMMIMKNPLLLAVKAQCPTYS